VPPDQAPYAEEMPAHGPVATPRPHPARRITATACLVLSVAMLLATPTLLRATRYDARIQTAAAQQADHRQRLLDSGASREALELHHETSEAQLGDLRIRRRVSFYARTTTHFGLTLGLFL